MSVQKNDRSILRETVVEGKILKALKKISYMTFFLTIMLKTMAFSRQIEN